MRPDRLEAFWTKRLMQRKETAKGKMLERGCCAKTGIVCRMCGSHGLTGKGNPKTYILNKIHCGLWKADRSFSCQNLCKLDDRQLARPRLLLSLKLFTWKTTDEGQQGVHLKCKHLKCALKSQTWLSKKVSPSVDLYFFLCVFMCFYITNVNLYVQMYKCSI